MASHKPELPGATSSSPVPAHIAIIMDGNGRWAENRGSSRIRGHREGAKRVDDIVTEATRLGVRYLTLYAFSTENWLRPRTEVQMLMQLLVHHLRTMDKKLQKNGVQLVAQGTLERLPPRVLKELDRVRKMTTVAEPKMFLNLSLSYGGRQEIVDAVQAIAREVRAGKLDPGAIDETLIRQHFYQPTFPDPDLLIRTGGEYRVSNFLLWQIAYTELYTTQVLWPDFREANLAEAIDVFRGRERRFGKTSEQVRRHEPTA